ncbi:MAG: glycosyltransferase family 2 protein [Planctomycetota bacterium]
MVLREDLASEEPADYYFILNPDTAVRPGIFQALLQFFDENPRASILGPRTESEPGTADHTAFSFPGLANSLSDGLRFGPLDRLLSKWITAPAPRDEAHRIDWVSGGGMFLRRKVLEEIGLFDERFFLYFEETDLCHRAVKAGFHTWYVPTAVMMHWAGASTGVATDGRPRKRMPGWWFGSRRHYLRNFHNLIYVALCDWAFVCGRSLWQLRAWIMGTAPVDPPHFLWDFVRYNLLGQRWDRK